MAGGIAISEAVRRDAEAVLPGLAISVVRNAVDTNHFAVPGDRDGAELDRLAGLEPAGPGVVRVGLVATYANWKGQDVFLDALARLAAEGRRYGVTSSRAVYDQRVAVHPRGAGAAGGGERARRAGRVRPVQPDTADVYRARRGGARQHPARALRATIAEAMGCGKPVVVAAAGGAAELFTPGYDGLGHAPGDTTGLAGAIARLAADPARDQLGANARRTALERFRKNGTGGRSQPSTPTAARTGTSPARGRGSGEERQPGLLRREATRFSMSPPHCKHKRGEQES